MRTETFTTDSGVEIQVHFDDLQYQLMEEDIDERMEIYECRGYDANGTQYSGIAEFSCDELESITDIEILTW